MVADRAASVNDALAVGRSLGVNICAERFGDLHVYGPDGQIGRVWPHDEGDYTALDANGDYLPGTYPTLADAVRALMAPRGGME